MHYAVFGRGNADRDFISLAPHGVPEQHFGRNGVHASSGEMVVQLEEWQGRLQEDDDAVAKAEIAKATARITVAR